MHRKVAFGCLVILGLPITGCSVFVWASDFRFPQNRLTHAQRAQDLRNEHEVDEAVKEYHLHIEQRLATANRPEWENPYFYYLLIGDTYLENDQPQEAKDAYLTAYHEKVNEHFIVDRLVQLANWYLKHRQDEAGISLLRQYRELDPLLIDNEIDQMHKKIVSEEDR